jgi:AcrR family transcriptional regulator
VAQPTSNEQILEAALAVIVRHGYVGATTREIAAEAGINEVTLFRRFGSKANLLEAVVAEEAARFAASGIGYSGDVEADLRAVYEFYASLMAHRGQIVLGLISEVARHPELLAIMEKPMGLMRRVAEILGRYQAAGVLVPEPLEQTVSALLGPLFLSAVIAQITQVEASPVDVDDRVQRFLSGRRVAPSRSV